MRLIDADSLKTKVEAMVVHRVIESDYDFGGNQAFDYVADILIEDAPTIDAVEVVRCKDCRHWRTSYCVIHGDSWEETDYCSDGEREGKR